MYTLLELFFRSQREELMELADIQILGRDKKNNSLTILVEGVTFTFILNNKMCWLGVTYFLLRNILSHGLAMMFNGPFDTIMISKSYTILGNELIMTYNSSSKNEEAIKHSVNILKGLMFKLFLVTILLIPVYIAIFIYEGIRLVLNKLTERKDKSA